MGYFKELSIVGVEIVVFYGKTGSYGLELSVPELSRRLRRWHILWIGFWPKPKIRLYKGFQSNEDSIYGYFDKYEFYEFRLDLYTGRRETSWGFELSRPKKDRGFTERWKTLVVRFWKPSIIIRKDGNYYTEPHQKPIQGKLYK